MNKEQQDRADKKAEENKRNREFFVGVMKGKMYEFDGKVISKGFVEITFQNSGRRIRAKDVNPNHKFPHIVTCLTPVDKNEFDTFYKIMEFEIKEIGVEAYREKKKQSYINK